MAKAAAARKTKQETAVPTTITLPELAKGEHYAGIALKAGVPTHHLILLPGELESGTWQEAGKWAKAQGGELPTRQEQSLLFANAREQFKERYYWSCEQHAAFSECAWGQNFGYGGQTNWRTDYGGRARAVRRLPI